MLDKVIHKHLDVMADIEDELSGNIENAINQIDITALVKDPHGELQMIVEAIEEMLVEKYFQRAISEGIDFAKEIKKSKEILVPDTTNPKLNEGIAIGDDKNRD